MRLIGRIVVLVAGAVWLGGLTFYAAVVIPTAHDVLGSHREVGFITQRVTERINEIAVAALAVLLLAVVAEWRRASRGVRIGFAATWLTMAGVQAGLFVLHPILDRLLDSEAHRILDRTEFYTLHRVYLIATTLQLLAGAVFLTVVLAAWCRQDRCLPAESP